MSPVPYDRSVHPEILTIPPGTAQHEATSLRSEQKELIPLFHETVDIEKAFIKQVVAALERKCLDHLRDPISNSIMLPICEVLDHLFQQYSNIFPAQCTFPESNSP